jgi:hypothetical protein
LVSRVEFAWISASLNCSWRSSNLVVSSILFNFLVDSYHLNSCIGILWSWWQLSYEHDYRTDFEAYTFPVWNTKTMESIFTKNQRGPTLIFSAKWVFPILLQILCFLLHSKELSVVCSDLSSFFTVLKIFITLCK